MSHLLNWIWVLLSVAAFVHWLRPSSRQRSPHRVGLFGLICVLALLFPVISDNDDLLQQEALSTPVSPVLKSLLQVKIACEHGTTPEIPAGDLVFPARAAQKLAAGQPAIVVSVVSLGATGDRSPPRIS